LSFQQIPKTVFDSQVAFNMLSHYGEESRPTLHDTQERVRKHIGVLLGGKAPAPALRLLHAPVFHGHAFSCFIELQQAIAVEALESTLDRPPLSLSRDAGLQPSAVSIAGSGEITLGRVEQDPACPAGYWVWGALDNLRIAAAATADIAEKLIAQRCVEGAS
jgi:aspartate-semialdehyde dehydrogenase